MELCVTSATQEKNVENIARVARPYPDSSSDGLHYLPLAMTPTNSRVTDDFMPRAQLKSSYESGQCTLYDPSSVASFSRKFVVAEGCVKQYLEHLTMLDLKKEKRKKEKQAKKSAEASKTYHQYNWNAMF
jgi:hypothetical protein